MVFGEIVEPSTRALIDDDFEEYPDYTKPQIVWQGDITVPPQLDTLIFIEGPKVIKLFNALVLNYQTPCATLESGDIQIYQTVNNKYIISYNKKSITTGEIVETLSEWITKAKHVYAIISEPLSAYQTPDLSEKPETLIRKLSTNTNNACNYQKLESPNLVSGLGADVVSYSIHTGLEATLFVVYMDNSPLDSVNTSSVIKLMKFLNLPVSTTMSNLNPVASNLYL